VKHKKYSRQSESIIPPFSRHSKTTEDQQNTDTSSWSLLYEHITTPYFMTVYALVVACAAPDALKLSILHYITFMSALETKHN